MSQLPFQLQAQSVAGSGAVAGDTTLILSSFKDIAGNNVAMASFGTKGYGTLEPNNRDQEEQISFTGLTQNSNGTATLTGVKSVAFGTPFTETSGLAKSHAGGVVFIISNTSGFENTYVNKDNDSTVTGTVSFATVPNAASDPVGGDDLARRSWVLSVVNGGAVTVSNLAVSGTAGETVVAGNLVYLKAADGRWWKSDADDSTTVNNVVLGIAQGSGSAGVSISSGILISGVDTHQSGLAAGTTYYASNTAGALSSSAGTVSKIVGVGASTTSIYFDPYFGELPTGPQKAALAGSSGSPSSTNKYVTQNNVYSTTADQTQTTQNTTTAVGEADATTKHNLLAQSFTPAVALIHGATLYKAADSTVSFTGTVTITLQADTAGSPSGVALATGTISNAAWLLIPVGTFDAVFSTQVSMTTGSLYWIVISTSTSDNTNHPNFGANTAGGYASGSSKFKNTTDGWTANGILDLYFQTLIGTTSQVAGTSSTTGLISSNVSPYSLVELNTTVTTLASSGTETTVYTKVLPVGFFNAASGFKITVAGVYDQRAAAASTQNVGIYLNGTVLSKLKVTANDGSLATTSYGFTEFYVINNAATNAQNIVRKSVIIGPNLSTVNSGLGTGNVGTSATQFQIAGTNNPTVETAAIDTSALSVLTVTMQNNENNAATQWSIKWVLLEKIG